MKAEQSLLQLLIQDGEDERVQAHLSRLSSTLVQLLQLHDFLHNRGLVLGEVVVLLACLDSPLWGKQLSDSIPAIEAVFVVLVGDFGFDMIPDRQRLEEGQEAAWAVLAAFSRHLVQMQPTNQVQPHVRVEQWMMKLHAPRPSWASERHTTVF